MAHDHDGEAQGGATRHHALECMIWAGTGILWTMAGGVPKSLGMLGTAEAATAKTAGFSFLQVSDSHVGFDKAANPHAIDTLREAIGKVTSMPTKPSFMIHTGDITHLSKPAQFDNAAQIIGAAGLDVHYVLGEHDLIDESNGKAYLDRYGKGTRDAGWYAFDKEGVHFIGLVNVVDMKAGGLGNLGAEQLAWLEDDLVGRPASTPLVVFAHNPAMGGLCGLGLGHRRRAQALALMKRFGSVTVLNGYIHQIIQKVEGNMTFHTARSTAFPQPAPGSAASPGPMTVPADQLRTMLGLTRLDVSVGGRDLALIDPTLA